MDITSFQHSLFLGALGNAILNSLWQGFLLWIIYETLIISYKNTNSKFKHNLSVLLIFCSFVWFVCTFIFKLQVSEKISSFAGGINNLQTLDKPKSSFSDIFTSFTGGILPYLSVAYISLLFFLMVKLFTAYRHVHFIANKNLISVPIHLETFASQVARQLNIPKKIKIWISNHIEVPATIGFIKPVILIPLASINQLTVSQLEAIILHELSHIKRNDYLVNLLVSIIETILFFNPFIAFFVKIIKRERENCCDDFVLQYRYDPHSYASALLRLEQSRKNNLQLALGAVSGKKQLLLRIKRITGTNTVTQFNYGQKLFALILTTAIFCSLAWLSPTDVKKIPEKKSAKIITQQSQFDMIVKKRTNENNFAKIGTSKNKKGKQKIQYQEIDSINIIGTPEINSAENDEKKMVSDKNFFKQFLSNNQAIKTVLNKDNIKTLILKQIPQLKIENVDINGKINEGLQEAYNGINEVNWAKVQSDINKSFSQIKTDKLPQAEKAQILKAKKYLELIKFDKQQFDVKKILLEIQGHQKSLQDSIKVVENSFNNQQSVKLDEQLNSNELQALNNSTKNFEFSFNSKSDHNKQLKGNKVNTQNKEPKNDLNGKELRINIQKITRDSGNINRESTKKTKESHNIIDI